MHPLWTDQALVGLDELRRYYVSRGSPETAIELAALLAQAADGLVGLPYLGRPGRSKGTRELVIPHVPFILVYQVESRRPHILAVIHGAREWPEQV